MAVTFEDALNTLQAMFSDWDRDALAVVLESNHYHLERTIEFVLSSSAPAAPPSEQSSSAPAPASAAARTEDLLGIGIEAPQQPQQQHAGNHSSSSSSSQNSHTPRTAAPAR
jgi:hypothetical protein